MIIDNLMFGFIANNTILFYGIVLLLSILSASFGIGSFILIPLAAITYGSKESIGIITIYFLFQNINKIIVFYRYIDWKIGIKIIVWSIPGVLAGSFLLNYISTYIFNKLLAIIILIYLANEVFKLIPQKIHTKKTLPIFGLIYGFSSGLVGNGNLVKGPLLTSLGLLKETYIGTYSLTSFFTNVPKTIVYYSSGIINAGTFAKSIPFLFLSILGTHIGKHFIKKINNKSFYYILNAVFAISAIALFFGD